MSSVLPTNYLTPTGREEAWRFTPLKRIAGLHDPAVSVIDRISIELFGSARAGFSISTVKASELPAKSETTDAIVQRLRSEVTEVLHLKIDNEAVINEPILLKRSVGSSGEFSRTVITAGAHSKASVIVENTGRQRDARKQKLPACTNWIQALLRKTPPVYLVSGAKYEVVWSE